MNYEESGGFKRKFIPEEDKKGGSVKPLRIDYRFFLEMLTDAMRFNTDEIGRIVLIPQYYKLFLNPEDRKMRQAYENTVITELTHELNALREEISRSDDRPLVVEFDDDAELEHFEAGVTVEMVAPADRVPKVVKAVSEQKSALKSEAKTLKTAKSVSAPVALEEFVDLEEEPVEAEKPSPPPVKAPVKSAKAVKSPGPAFKLDLYKDDNYAGSYPLIPGKPLIAGRDLPPKSDIFLEDPERKISARHLTVTLDVEEVKLTADGKNGLEINGRFVEQSAEKMLHAGDRINVRGGIAAYTLVLSSQAADDK